ncbi:MAG: glycosyltransferase, partial [Bacteroidetes bacterium]|nr:glycosyltransferase [Bacteroidota bacterium]
MEKEITVSICCVTYNHGNYIRECLEGFVKQQTNFNFEILVHDDASTDNTAGIVKEYELKYPHLFKCVYQTENQFYKQNTLVNILFKMAKGKYIALCEGDDYWIDPYKLQKQVDFLELHPEIFICGTNTKVVYEDGTPSHLFNISPRVEITEERLLPIEQLISPLVPFHTSSVMFRKIATFPSWFSSINNGDIAIFFLCALRGKVGVLPDVTSVYRRHATGITTTYLKGSVDTRSYLTLYHLLDKESERAYHHLFRPLIFDFMVNHISALLREKKFRLARIT